MPYTSRVPLLQVCSAWPSCMASTSDQLVDFCSNGASRTCFIYNNGTETRLLCVLHVLKSQPRIKKCNFVTNGKHYGICSTMTILQEIGSISWNYRKASVINMPVWRPTHLISKCPGIMIAMGTASTTSKLLLPWL